MFADLDRRSADQVRDLLSGLSESDRRRLVSSMETIRGLLEAQRQPTQVLLRPARTGDFGWIVQRHGDLYSDEYGWDETFEALVARIVADFVDHHNPKREAAWIAEVDGERAGCVLCVEEDADTAKLRVLLVEPWARGMGVGSRLVTECLDFARRAGYGRMVLTTNHVLDAARRIYERAGFVRVEDGGTEEHELVNEHWERTL